MTNYQFLFFLFHNLIFVKFFQPVVCNDQIQVPNSTGDIDPCGT